MATVVTAKEFGERVGLEHTEVIRRIRRQDILAEKLGWFWVIDVKEIDRVTSTDWYQRVMKRRGLQPEVA